MRIYIYIYIEPRLRLTQDMKLLRSTKSNITKDKNVENVPHLEIIEVVLVHFVLSIFLSRTIINRMQESCIHLFLINRLVNY